MTLPTSHLIVADSFNRLWQSIINLQRACQTMQTVTAGGAAATGDRWVNLASQAVSFRNVLAAIQGDSAFATAVVNYAKTATNSTTLSAADFIAADTAAAGILTALTNEFPHDGSGHLLDRSFDLSTGLQIATFTASDMPQTMSAISAYLALLS